MSAYNKKDLKFSFLLLSPLFLRLLLEIGGRVVSLFIKVNRINSPLVKVNNSNPVFDLIGETIISVFIYTLAFLYVYLSLYFARRQRKWALQLPYLTLLPILIIIIVLVLESIKTSWEGFFWVILLGGPIYLIVNIAIFIIMKRRVESAFKEGLYSL